MVGRISVCVKLVQLQESKRTRSCVVLLLHVRRGPLLLLLNAAAEKKEEDDDSEETEEDGCVTDTEGPQLSAHPAAANRRQSSILGKAVTGLIDANTNQTASLIAMLTNTSYAQRQPHVPIASTACGWCPQWKLWSSQDF